MKPKKFNYDRRHSQP